MPADTHIVLLREARLFVALLVGGSPNDYDIAAARNLLAKLDAALRAAPAPEPAPLTECPICKDTGQRVCAPAAEPASGVPPLLRVVKQCPRHEGAVMMMTVGYSTPAIPYCPNCEQEDAERERREGGRRCQPIVIPVVEERVIKKSKKPDSLAKRIKRAFNVHGLPNKPRVKP